MPSIEGSCLCGTVRVAVAKKPRRLTQCNCSVCRRYGALWAYYLRRAVTIAAPRSGLESFSRRPRGLRFVRCTTCGCVVSWEARRGPDARMAVNARLLDHAAVADVPISVLDGDKTWRVLETYTKPGAWISPKRRQMYASVGLRRADSRETRSADRPRGRPRRMDRRTRSPRAARGRPRSRG